MRRASLFVLIALLPAAVGCGDSSSEPATDTIGADGADVAGLVGATGGTVIAPGVSLSVPPRALASGVPIAITPIAISGEGGAPLTAYRFTPEGLTFAPPALVTFTLDGAPSGETGVWWSRPGSDADFGWLGGVVEGDLLTVKVTHFSVGYVGLPPTSPELVLQLGTDSLSFAAQAGGAAPAAQSVAVNGGLTLPRPTATVQYGPGASGWLTTSVSSGPPPYSVGCAVDLAGLGAGSYDATAQIAAAGSPNSPQAVAVALTVAPAAATAASRVRWSFQPTAAADGSGAALRVGLSTAAVSADGAAVYFVADDGGATDCAHSALFAVAAADGHELWRLALPECANAASPSVATDGTVYLGTRGHHVHAVSAAGSERWQRDVLDVVRSYAAIAADGTVYVGTGDYFAGTHQAALWALAPETGEPRWSFSPSEQAKLAWSAPAVGTDGTVYASACDGQLHAVSADGDPQWAVPVGVACGHPPAIGLDGTVYVGSYDGALDAVSSAGVLRWRFRTLAALSTDQAPTVGADGTVYFAASDDYVYAVGPDGALRWLAAMRGTKVAIAADGTLFVTSYADGLLRALRGSTGELLWSQWLAGSPAAGATLGPDGTIYLAGNVGPLNAITGGAGGPAVAPWALYGGDAQHTGRR